MKLNLDFLAEIVFGITKNQQHCELLLPFLACFARWQVPE